MSMKRDDVAELIAAAQFLLGRRDTEANYYGRVLAEIAKRQLDAESEASARIAELEKDAQNVMAELDAMNANFQGMLKDRNAWRDKARELEKDAARYQTVLAMGYKDYQEKCAALDLKVRSFADYVQQYNKTIDSPTGDA